MSTVKLGDVARESRLKWERSKLDVPIVGLEHLIPGEIRFEAYDKNIDNTFSKKFVKGQVLFGRRRSYQRKAAVAEFDGICSGDITVIETIGGKMVSELLPFIIQTPAFFDYANKGSAGSLSPRVKWEHLADYEFELPSLKEQKVLADKLWAAYRLKEGYKKLYVATDEMVKSQFIEMFGNPLSSKQENELKKLGECCILNPRRPNIALCDTDKVSFVPMSAVSEDGYLIDMIDEEYGKVKKGFTYFDWNVSAADAGGCTTSSCVYNSIVNGLSKSRVNVVLIHDTKMYSADALSDVIKYAKKLQEQGARNVLVSMAGEGAVLVAEDGQVYKSPCPKGKVKNSVGAGDSMVAGFIAGYLETGDYKEALRKGLLTGSASAFSDNLATKEEVEELGKTFQLD